MRYDTGFGWATDGLQILTLGFDSRPCLQMVHIMQKRINALAYRSGRALGEHMREVHGAVHSTSAYRTFLSALGYGFNSGRDLPDSKKQEHQDLAAKCMSLLNEVAPLREKNKILTERLVAAQRELSSLKRK